MPRQDPAAEAHSAGATFSPLEGVIRRREDHEVVEHLHYVHGSLEGPYWRRVGGEYRCDGAAFEVGTFDRGVRVGTVRLLDANEHEVARFELGRAAVDDEILEAGVLSNASGSVRSMTGWLEVSERALSDRRLDEGLVALARAVAKGADPQRLELALGCYTLPTSSHEAAERAVAVAHESSPRLVLAALVAGAEPVAILRRLAALLGGGVALDMIEAAVGIAADPIPLLFTRAVLRVMAGNVAGARHDARTLKHVRPHEYDLLMAAISVVEEGGATTVRAAS